MLKIFVILSIACVFAANAEKYMDSIATRSTKVEGYLKCGNNAYQDAYVRLYRSSSEDLNDVIASGKSDSNGRFSIEGDTSRFGGEIIVLSFDSAIDPYLRIYHKCDEAETKSGFRKVELRFPRDFVTLGRIPRRPYNIGAINLELGFPKEAREKNTEGFSA